MSEFGNSEGRSGSSTPGRWFAGCGLGCLVALLLATVTCVGMWWWATSPGKQVDPAALVTEADHGLVVVDGLGNDPGLRALTTRALDEWNRAASDIGGDAPWGQWSASRERSIGDSESDTLPQDFAVLLLAGPERIVPVGVVNLPKGPRVLRLVLDLVWPDQGGASTTVHRRHSVRTVGGSFSGAFVGGTILVGARPGDVAIGLDRALDASGTGAEQDRAMRERWDVWGRFRDRDGRAGPWVAAVLVAGAQRAAGAGAAVPPLEAISSVVLGLDVVDAASGRGELAIEFVDEAAARAWAPLVGPAIEALAHRWAGDGVEMRADLNVSGRQVLGPLEVRGLDEVVSRLVRVGAEALDRKANEPAPP